MQISFEFDVQQESYKVIKNRAFRQNYQAKAEIACIIFHLLMSTHVYVLQRLKALGDGENGATILHWTLWESALNAYCSEVQQPITPIFTPYIVFRQVNAWGKNQRRRLFECKVIKGHSILYRQPMEINV